MEFQRGEGSGRRVYYYRRRSDLVSSCAWCLGGFALIYLMGCLGAVIKAWSLKPESGVWKWGAEQPLLILLALAVLCLVARRLDRPPRYEWVGDGAGDSELRELERWAHDEYERTRTLRGWSHFIETPLAFVSVGCVLFLVAAGVALFQQPTTGSPQEARLLLALSGIPPNHPLLRAPLRAAMVCLSFATPLLLTVRLRDLDARGRRA